MAVSTSTPSAPSAQVDPSPTSLVALLIALTADYPDLDGPTVAQAVEHAAVAAQALSPGLAIGPQHVEALARDRLDAAAERAVRARSRDTRAAVHPTARTCPTGCGPNPVDCLYCREPIPSDTFAYRSIAKRLVCATCPSCGQFVTLRATTWRRLSTRTWAPAGTPQR